MSMDLRTELGAKADPDYELELPRGWVRSHPDEHALKHMLTVLRDRTQRAHLPEAYVQVKKLLEDSFAQMRQHAVTDVFMPGTEGAGTLYLPASMTGSVVHATPEQTLEQLVHGMVRDLGARPLRGDTRIVRMAQERRMRIFDATLMNHTITYLTPIPGTKRRRALRLVASFGHLPELPDYDSQVRVLQELFDSCAASLRWKPAGQGAPGK